MQAQACLTWHAARLFRWIIQKPDPKLCLWHVTLHFNTFIVTRFLFFKQEVLHFLMYWLHVCGCNTVATFKMWQHTRLRGVIQTMRWYSHRLSLSGKTHSLKQVVFVDSAKTAQVGHCHLFTVGTPEQSCLIFLDHSTPIVALYSTFSLLLPTSLSFNHDTVILQSRKRSTTSWRNCHANVGCRLSQKQTRSLSTGFRDRFFLYANWEIWQSPYF